MIFNMTGGCGGSSSTASLNFKIVGGTTKPSNATENTIWINTSTDITSWVFSAEQPSNPTSGMVWISTGNSSNAAFNALKKNAIYIYPMFAKQYVGGKWVDVECLYYQNGKWNEPFITSYVFQNGVFKIGNFVGMHYDEDYHESYAAIEGGKIVIDVEGSMTAYFHGSEAIDLSAFSKLIFVVSYMYTEDTSKSGVFKYGISSNANSTSLLASGSTTVRTSNSSKEYSVDLSSVNGSYYITAGVTRTVNSSNDVVIISEIRLET